MFKSISSCEVTIALLFSSALFAQVPSVDNRSLPPGAIDGSKTPDLIPDTVALRLVFSAFRIPAAAPEEQIARAAKRQELLLKRLNLTDADKSAFRATFVSFDRTLGAWETTTAGALESGQVFAVSPDVQRDQIVMDTWGVLRQQLTPSDWEHLVQYVKDAKRTMLVWP